jgi:hypothetical protein
VVFAALKKTKIHQKSQIFKNQALYGQTLIKDNTMFLKNRVKAKQKNDGIL